MFEWVLNTPPKIVEYNLKIYLTLFNWKIHVLIDFHFAVFTHDNFLYLKFIRCTFRSDFWEISNLIKSIFGKCKESTRETVKAKINDASFRIFKKINSRLAF